MFKWSIYVYCYFKISQHSYEQYYSIITLLIITYWLRYLKQPSFALLISQLLLVIQKMS